MDTFVDNIHPHGVWKNSDPIDLTDRRVRPILLYFWRSHTPESVQVLHELDALTKRDSLPVDIIAIHAPEFDDALDSWEDIIDEFGIRLPVFHDPEFKTWNRFNVQHAPYYLLIDENGNEIVRRAGTLEDSGIRDFIDELR